MHFGEPADELRFVIWFRAALCEIGKILEEGAEQIRVAGTGLFQGRIDNVRDVLREREFRSLDIGDERRETGCCRLEAPSDGALDFGPAERAIRDNSRPRLLGPGTWSSRNSGAA